MKHSGVNWNERREQNYPLVFWNQNIANFWTEEEIAVSDDKNTWANLMTEEQLAYKRVLGGLTLLDTKQGGEGMPLIAIHERDLQSKAVLMFMGGMEEVHAKSYSYIFTTLANEEEINAIFKWVDEHPALQYKANRISTIYKRLLKPEVSVEELWMAMVASVFLESYLFYSGFFYPLYLAGQGKMIASGEVINLILRDESIHGVFVGLRAQELWREMDEYQQSFCKKHMELLLEDLMDNEINYTEEVYSPIGLTAQVEEFLKYNANKALMNLGFDPKYENVHINPIVEAGLNTDTKNHDFFSVKGNGYISVAKNIEKLTDDDLNFDF